MRSAKVCKVIDSCVTQEQFDTAVALAFRFAEVYKLKEDDILADLVNGTIEDKEEALECQRESTKPKIGFLR